MTRWEREAVLELARTYQRMALDPAWSADLRAFFSRQADAHLEELVNNGYRTLKGGLTNGRRQGNS